ncbi:metalloregulator ArsR/SmtB family transcription factor [Paraclostridium sordellii]
MDKCHKQRLKLAKEFKECQSAFVALGDETRHHIIIALLESDTHGIRVGEITKRTHLSRPAVSHHLQILKNAGIISMYREGTKNYYYVSASETVWKQLAEFVGNIYGLVQEISNKSCAKSDAERKMEE